MNEPEVSALYAECLMVAGLIAQRDEGADVDSLLSQALGRLPARQVDVRRILGTPPVKSPPLGELDTASPLAALRARLLSEPEPRVRGKAREHVANAQRDLLLVENDELRAELRRLRAAASRTRGLADAVFVAAHRLVEGLGDEEDQPVAPRSSNGRGRAHQPALQLDADSFLEQAGVNRPAASAPPAALPRAKATSRDRALAVLAAYHPGSLTRDQVAGLTGMAVRGGGFASLWGELRASEFVEETGRGLYRITQTGLDDLGAARPPVPRTLKERVALWSGQLGEGGRRMLEVVADAGAAGIARIELASRAGLAPRGGAFGKELGALRRANLTSTKGRGRVVLHPWLLNGPEAAHG